MRVVLALLMGLMTWTASAQQQVVATLFGDPVYVEDISPSEKQLSQLARLNSASKNMALAQFRHRALADKVIQRVLDDYADKRGIKVDQALVAKFKARFAASLNSPSMTESEQRTADEIATKQVLHWQIDKALYQEFGGTVVFQQSNPQMPAGAYEILLKQYQQQGAFMITDPRYQAVFWEAIEPPYPFELAPDKIDFSQPWWLN
ncbi:hypothetical protein GCM10007391_14740 [Alteromonas halophila]|uniref:Peptidylprolyl isomerase n=2 Tax=Alteromonas halophila TaxID=516698 RepID=A0A918MY97_9ALTE|nr:hypothetical protein GCM10007391_14740 [Alteromonas halophila]